MQRKARRQRIFPRPLEDLERWYEPFLPRVVQSTARRVAIDSSDRSLRSTSEDGALVTYTDTHLAHGIGEALRHAYHGELDSQWTDEDGLLRISWTR